MRTPQDAPTDPDKLIRLGTIASVDLAAGTCVVTLDTGADTASIKWTEARCGDTRTWNPPSVGEQVKLDCPGGEIGAAVVSASVPSTANPPAGNTAAPNITFKDGAQLSYDPETHALTFTLPGGATMVIAAPGGATITGPVTLDGDVTINGTTTLNGDATATGTITGETDVVGAGKSVKGLRVKGVTAGSGISGTPV